MSAPQDLVETKTVVAGRIAHSVADVYFEKAVREIERLNEVLASIAASTNHPQARRRAREGRTCW